MLSGFSWGTQDWTEIIPTQNFRLVLLFSDKTVEDDSPEDGMSSSKMTLQFTPTPAITGLLLYAGANCNRDCPFKVAFGEGTVPLAP